MSDDSICASDHFPLVFEVKTKVVHKKPPKRKIFNFKKANWHALNCDLLKIPWDDILDGMEPELAWSAFKNITSALTQKYIPTITIRSNFTLPWFDSECFDAYRDKQHAHKKFKKTKTDINDLKFKTKRRSFKNICSKK